MNSYKYLKVLSELCKYSLPYLMGWQALSSYEFDEKFLSEESI